MSKIRFVGLDVHAETIAVVVAEPRLVMRLARWECAVWSSYC